MSEEFQPVTRKKWLAKPHSKTKGQHNHNQTYSANSTPIDVDKFLTRFEQKCERMTNSDYFTQSISTLDEALTALDVSSHDKLKRIVCFGIGPFTRSFQAFHQLAFILSAQRHCNITEALYYDPVFSESEKSALERLKCIVMPKNCEAKYEADALTLFYMPHCPNELANNLLWRNWRPENLTNLVLINNSFETLGSAKPERLLKLDSNYLLDVLAYVQEFPLEDDYEARNVFNDLAVHVFPILKLPEKHADFWLEKEAPTYAGAEMITAEEFDKLNIS